MDNKEIIAKLDRDECSLDEIRIFLHHEHRPMRGFALLALARWMDDRPDYVFDRDFIDELIDIASDPHVTMDFHFPELYYYTTRLLAIGVLREIGTPQAVNAANDIAGNLILANSEKRLLEHFTENRKFCRDKDLKYR